MTDPTATMPSSDRDARPGTGLLRATPIAALLGAIATAIVKAADTLPSDVLFDTSGGKHASGLPRLSSRRLSRSSLAEWFSPCSPGSRERRAASSSSSRRS